MVATHLPLLRDGRRADQVLQWLGRPGKFPLNAHLLEHDALTWNQR